MQTCSTTPPWASATTTSDDGIAGLRPFADLINFDLLAANLIETPDGSTPIYTTDNTKKSTVVVIDDVKVGIVGYITASTPGISSPDDTLSFEDEITSVGQEALRLKEEEGVQIIIALGHAGYDDVDLHMAYSIPDVDLVVGGHSHTFLYPEDETPPDIDVPKGPYPHYVTQPSGKVVPVVQAYCYTKYIGLITLNFDVFGELYLPEDGVGVSKAQVILLDSSIEQNQMVEEAMEKYR